MDSFAVNVKEKQLEALYSNISTIVSLTLVVTTALACALLIEFPKLSVISWALYMYVISLARWYSLKHFKKEGFQKRGMEFWFNLFIFFSVSASLGTGYLIFAYFDQNNLVYTIFVFMTYAGYISAGIMTNSVYMPAFFAYSLPPTLIVLVRLFLNGDPAFFAISIVIVFYFVALIAFGRKANRTFTENIIWNLEKDSLVQELRKQKEAAEQATHAKSQFFASASHDLRQPLHALGLFHDALRYRLTKPENIEIMDKISNSTHSLNDLLHDMLDISKLDASVIENKPENINLSHALSFVSNEFLARTREKNLSLVVDVDPMSNILVDPILFERVVRNLIDNAIKYTEKGAIKVRSEENTQGVSLLIEDTGIGIPDDELENVFSEFNQLGNPGRDKQKGLGLGLSIVKRLCNLMEIELNLESELTKGTTFTLLIDKGESHIQEDRKSPSKLTGSNASILIIEDDPAVMEGMSIFLGILGFNINQAIDSEQALTMASQKLPDLILADYRLPGEMDGLKLIQTIRAKYELMIPAILITGETAPEKLKDVDQSDVCVLHKPVQSVDLENIIHKVLAEQ